MNTVTESALLYPMAMPDEGRINERILRKEARKDFLASIESSRLGIETTLRSPEGKRLYVRVFDSLQLAVHFISVIARTGLEHEIVEKVEEELKKAVDSASAEMDEALDGAELLLKSNQIQNLSKYAAAPLVFEAAVLSSFGRRYLETIVKFDQLMPMLETLAIYEIITEREKDLRKGLFKKAIRRVASAAREFSIGLRRRMNAKAAAPTAAGTAEHGDAAEIAATEAQADVSGQEASQAPTSVEKAASKKKRPADTTRSPAEPMADSAAAVAAG